VLRLQDRLEKRFAHVTVIYEYPPGGVWQIVKTPIEGIVCIEHWKAGKGGFWHRAKWRGSQGQMLGTHACYYCGEVTGLIPKDLLQIFSILDMGRRMK
jgi:hypothetical protein